VEIYNELLKKGEAFEIVFLSRDEEEKDFEEYYASMPWLALPFADNTVKELSRYFRVKGIPFLIILGPDGKTVRLMQWALYENMESELTHLQKSGWMRLKLRRSQTRSTNPGVSLGF
jgi:hypothetical protein